MTLKAEDKLNRHALMTCIGSAAIPELIAQRAEEYLSKLERKAARCDELEKDLLILLTEFWVLGELPDAIGITYERAADKLKRLLSMAEQRNQS